jgi:hypothetical protein
MGLYEAIKDGVEVARKADNIQVMKQLLDAQKELLDLFDENRKLKERIRELEVREDVSRNLRYDGERYWLTRDGAEDGPYCSVCFDHDGKLIRLTNGATRGSYWCGVCSTKRR